MIQSCSYKDDDLSLARFLNLPKDVESAQEYIALVKNNSHGNNVCKPSLLVNVIAAIFSFGVFRNKIVQMRFEDKYKLMKRTIYTFLFLGALLGVVTLVSTHSSLYAILITLGLISLCYSSVYIWYEMADDIIVLEHTINTTSDNPYTYISRLHNSSVSELIKSVYVKRYNALTPLLRFYHTMRFVSIVASNRNFDNKFIYGLNNMQSFSPKLNKYDRLFIISSNHTKNIDIMAWNDLTDRQKELDRAIESSGIKLDESRSCLRKVMSAIGASSSEEEYVRNRIQLRLRAEALLSETDNVIADTEKLLKHLEQDAEEMKRKGRDLGFNW